MEFMIRHDGRELGPYSEPEVRGRLIAGTLALSDLGLAEGATEWAPLSAFAQFAASYRDRLGFFYARSPYWDQELNHYPVARIVQEQDLQIAR